MFVAYSLYKRIAQDQSVEDWVKTRYKLMINYVFFILIPATLLIFTLSQTDIFTLSSINSNGFVCAPIYRMGGA
ncbi:MAG: hypothetical protein JSW11_11655 [Candidatus Heimdallarchaeota archaeon]|nr:MAG: hypothetical protein JSW11_11655 [Candidatus Heimdallarchaeota archaeon]